jgi:hemolysin III
MQWQIQGDTVTTKPKLRGVSHLLAAIAAVPVAFSLIESAADEPTLLPTYIYACVLFLLFGISAVYHVPNWSQSRRAFLRRLDRSMIYLFIAGTYTPMLAKLEGSVWVHTNTLVWVAALTGVLFTIVFTNLPRWARTLPYIGLGWGAVILLPALYTQLGSTAMWLIVSGGLLFTIGGVIYARKRPNPWPNTFGYHEIFHLLVIGAVILHYYAVIS